MRFSPRVLLVRLDRCMQALQDSIKPSSVLQLVSQLGASHKCTQASQGERRCSVLSATSSCKTRPLSSPMLCGRTRWLQATATPAARSNLRGGIRAQGLLAQPQTAPGYPPIRGLGTRGRQTDLGPGAPAAPSIAPGSKHGWVHHYLASTSAAAAILPIPASV